MTVSYESYRLKKMANLVKDCQSILDLGWCQNPNPYFNNQDVVGLDLNLGQIPRNYSQCIQGDVTKLEDHFTGETFNAVVAGEIIEHLENPLTLLRGCFHVLKTNSILVLSTPNPNSLIERLLTLNLSRRYFYSSDHITLFPQRWLIRVMELAGFKQVNLLSGGFPLPFWGTIPFPRPWCYHTIAIGKKLIS